MKLSSKKGTILPGLIAVFFLVYIALGFSYERGDLRDDGDYSCRDCNVVLISLDTLRADHLGSYGYYRNTSPNIDALAQKGVLYEKTISQSSWTGPSHASIFTSLYPSDLDFIFAFYAGVVAENVTTLTEVLLQNNYSTAGFQGGWVLDPEFMQGFSQGFNVYESHSNRMEGSVEPISSWLEENYEKKFFLFLHNYNCHEPYTPPPPYNGYFTENARTPGEYIIEDEQEHMSNFTQQLLKVYNEGGGLPEENRSDLDYLISQYDGEIAYVDYLVGEFVKELNGYGILNKTIIVITSDHGEEFFEHGHLFHGITVYDEIIHVPLIVYSPGIPEGVRVREQVRSTDIMPSILDLLGVDYSGFARGESVIPLAYGKTKNLVAISEHGSRSEADDVVESEKYSQSVREADWKMIYSNTTRYFTEKDNQRLIREIEYELFDLRKDPQERFNIAGKNRRQVLWLQKYMSVGHEATENTGVLVPVNESVKETLRALGYVR